MAKWTAQYGQVYKFYIGLDHVLVVTDPVEVVNFCSNSNRQDNLPKFWKAYLATETVAAVLAQLVSTHWSAQEFGNTNALCYDDP